MKVIITPHYLALLYCFFLIVLNGNSKTWFSIFLIMALCEESSPGFHLSMLGLTYGEMISQQAPALSILLGSNMWCCVLHACLCCCSSHENHVRQDVVEVNPGFTLSCCAKSTRKIWRHHRRLFICHPSVVPLKCQSFLLLSAGSIRDYWQQTSSLINKHQTVTYAERRNTLHPHD